MNDDAPAPWPAFERLAARLGPERWPVIADARAEAWARQRQLEKERYASSDETRLKILDSYNAFLRQLNDEAVRERLAKLSYREAINDAHFAELRDISHGFQDGPTRFFFHENETIRELMRVYAVF